MFVIVIDFQRHTHFLVKLQCLVFSSATLFLGGSQLNFSSAKKNCQMKVGEITDMIITKTLSCYCNQTSSKGQLISQGLFGVIVWTKNPSKGFKDFCPSL